MRNSITGRSPSHHGRRPHPTPYHFSKKKRNRAPTDHKPSQVPTAPTAPPTPDASHPLFSRYPAATSHSLDGAGSTLYEVLTYVRHRCHHPLAQPLSMQTPTTTRAMVEKRPHDAQVGIPHFRSKLGIREENGERRRDVRKMTRTR